MTQKKAETIYFWLKFIYLILAFSFFLDMKLILCIKNWDVSIHQHVQKIECTKLELFCFIFCRSNKKVYGFNFFWGGVTLYYNIFAYVLHWWILTKVSGAKDKIKRWQLVHEKRKSQTRGPRKIQLTLFGNFSLSLGRRSLVFLSRWKTCWCFDQSWTTPIGCRLANSEI